MLNKEFTESYLIVETVGAADGRFLVKIFRDFSTSITSSGLEEKKEAFIEI